MDISYFEQLWNKREIDKGASQAFWDSRAKEFNEKIATDEDKKRRNKILTLLTTKGMLTSDSNVLDIGCGPGKYVVEFGKQAQSVVGIDVSPRMIEYAKENTAREGLSNTELKVLDWHELNLDSFGWKKKFDLVFAAMSPAINSKDTLEKMTLASRGYCYLSSFVERTDVVKDRLSKYIVKEKEKDSYGKGIYSSFNILWLMGFYPEITYIDTKWEQFMTLDRAIDFYCSYFTMEQKVSSEQKGYIRNYLLEIAENGLVQETIKSKVAWLYWKV